jgi:hypothetical protein
VPEHQTGVECDTPEEAARAAKAVGLDLLEDESGPSLDPRPEFVVVFPNISGVRARFRKS